MIAWVYLCFNAIILESYINLSKSQAQHTGVKTKFNVKWPFIVIHDHLFLDQWKDSTSLYNNVGLIYIIMLALFVKIPTM